ncbi:ATP-dependent RNA helicase HrpA [Branchiibius hedensis]|uniref:ATP-dependent RNA helicase HrpA n=1 Tax=Branchiibius hedensis TaxID=672460 RepID=UPI003CCC8C0C
MANAGDRAAARAAVELPPLRYPPDLPVSAARPELLTAIRDHQVVVIAGETGSGKTTQIPKMCLELGRGRVGMIGHTQPRRIAARSVAARLAEEIGVELGDEVGWQVRFTDHTSPQTLVKVMTDGILLAALQGDRDLRAYDTIIIDEAHERSLTIDFLLGYLKQLLPRRPDLKVIITSATIDPQRFADHFAAPGRPVPIIEVSGRTYPVEVRYRPLVREVPGRGADAPPVLVGIDQVSGIVEAVEELWTESAGDGGPQDILVFCSGEREIRDAREALEGLRLPDTSVLPLFGRLSVAEQQRIFAPTGGRRIVVATNVAETSLTVPGIRYVVDTGTARISRYSQRTKVQRLPIEPISQASAGQRAGRCGRLADGICIRLYDEEDFLARPEFTEPEILRTNLASVILQMAALRLGDIEKFPFVQAPDSRQIADGRRLLQELEAISTDGRLTKTGRTIARLPVDPRLARMLIAADQQGALREALVIVSALSIQDPRERPQGAQAQADQSHARFKDDQSDFIGYLNLWNYLKDQQKALSHSAFRRMCGREFLHYLRIREWQDLHTQVRDACRQQGLRTHRGHPASPLQIHQSLLPGLLSHVGLRERATREYLGARGARFSIQPGSTLYRKQPDWVMSAELVETTRLWARVNAPTDPAWVEAAAQHLVKRSYSEPRWDRKRGSAVADERVTLYGIPLVAGRRVGYAAIDPVVSRELFLRHGLVEGDWDSPHQFLRDNHRLVEQVAALEDRTRRRDLLVGEDELFAFYDLRVPETVVSGTDFDTWWKFERKRNPDLLTFTEDFLVRDEAGPVDVTDYPTTWRQGELELPLTYQFSPGSDADGVTVHIRLEQLNQVQPEGFDWLVPGLREDLAVALLRSLPKPLRRNFVPAPDFAKRAIARVEPGPYPFAEALADALHDLTGVDVRAADFDLGAVPPHLRMTFRVERSVPRRRGRPRTEKVAEGNDLDALKATLAGSVRAVVAKAGASIEQTGLTGWSFGELPEEFEQTVNGRAVQGFPALVDDGSTVSLRVLPSAGERDHATALGLRRLLLLNTTVPWKQILGALSNTQRLTLATGPYADLDALLTDVVAAAIDTIVATRMPEGTVRDEAQFEQALLLVRQHIVPTVLEIVALLVPILQASGEVTLLLDRMNAPAVQELVADVRADHAALIAPGFISRIGLPDLAQVRRYLLAMKERLEKGPSDLRRDADRAATIAQVLTERDLMVSRLPADRRTGADVRAIDAMIRELRVSLFANRLGTAYPVSPQRIYKAMDKVEAVTPSR